MERTVKRNIQILECPSNLGLKEPSFNKEPGVKLLPEFLRKNGFYKILGADDIITISPPKYAMTLEEESGVRNANNIVQYAKNQAEYIVAGRRSDKFSLVIGGDCSILVGCALGLKQSGNFALFYLDGHTDYIPPELSNTGGAAGMVLAIVTGLGHSKLTDVYKLGPYFNEEDIWCVGNRCYESDYLKPMMDSKINYFDLIQLRKLGISKCVDQFLTYVSTNNLDGFFIHFDVDVLNDEVMSAVDSRQKDGLTYTELNQLLEPLLKSEYAIGMEITILDPGLDSNQSQIRNFVINVGETLRRCLI